METVSCDFCGSHEAAAVTRQTDKLHRTTDEIFTIVRCLKCGLHYTNPRPPANEIGRYYADTYEFHAAPSKKRRIARLAAAKIANGPLAAMADVVPAVGRKLVPYVLPRIPDPVRLYYAGGGKGAFLDIGCGAGTSAHFWGEKGALLAYRRLTEVAGVEVAERARSTLAAAGIEAWSDLDQVAAQKRFGMIRMNWSLEHVYSPARYFSFLRERLIPSGRAMIAVPNYDGLIYRLAPDCVELPIHLYHFRPQDIENYAARFGLRVTSLETFSYPQMFATATEVGLLPKTFVARPGVRAARAFQSALAPFDRARWGNDMIAVLTLQE